MPASFITTPPKSDDSAIVARFEQIRQARVYKPSTFPDRSTQVAEAIAYDKKVADDKKAADDAEAARIAAEAQAAVETAQPAPVAYVAPVVPVVSGSAKAFIYSHESGNNPGAINPGSGACGLGQALPCSKMGCNLTDYACQDQFFTNYMLNRYGSWEAARSFWLAHNWW